MNVGELKRQVRDWLNSKNEPITEIARDLNISYFWVQRFMKGDLDNPRSNRLEYLVGRMQAEKRPEP
jgi:hypothetical protein